MQRTSSSLVLYIRCRLSWLGKASQSWRWLHSRCQASWIQKVPKSSSLVIQVGRDGEPENKPSVVVGLSDANALAGKSSLSSAAKRRRLDEWDWSSASASHCRRAPSQQSLPQAMSMGLPVSTTHHRTLFQVSEDQPTLLFTSLHLNAIPIGKISEK